MSVTIENVENLTITLSSDARARPSLADMLKGATITRLDATEERELGDICQCVFCKLRRAPLTPRSAAPSGGAPAAIPALGQPWPEQGGVNGGLMRGIAGAPDYYQIVAVGEAGGIAEISWAARSCADGDTEAKSKNDGLANTKLLAESALDFPAAKWARSLTIEGHSDFYLPSQRELAVACANVPEVFDDGYHWSSTQYSRNGAWCQDFVGGYQNGGTKSALLRARAFRRFIP